AKSITRLGLEGLAREIAAMPPAASEGTADAPPPVVSPAPAQPTQAQMAARVASDVVRDVVPAVVPKVVVVAAVIGVLVVLFVLMKACGA
ncbi:MAG: hypothetical protein ABUT39_03665, partial [Acidobacteriota bacterium]